jgi:UDP-glucuronate decarboxylase
MHKRMNNYMWIENDIFKEDLNQLMTCDYIPWNKLRNKTVLVTGATGLIGYNLISGLVYANINKKLNIHILALVRDIDKAKEKFTEEIWDSDTISFVSGTVESLPNIQEKVDYIIHGACPTASAYFIERPVETIKTSVLGTNNMLELAKSNNVEGFVYLSSMEVYGAPKTEDLLSEEDLGYLNPLNVRNCYPESKRMSESLIASYASEYGIRSMSIRLAQTFGPGVEYGDKRVFAEFARCAMEKKDIVLLTDGKSKRCYLYTMDAVSAILTVLLKGEAGQAYNAANPETYCSVKEMAEMVAKEIGNGEIKVIISKNEEDGKKFPPFHFYKLNIVKCKQIGWMPCRRLQDMYRRMIGSYGKDFTADEC